jgi:hypothetical protein
MASPFIDSPYTENQQFELSRHPQLVPLFEYFEKNLYQLNVGYCFFFFSLYHTTSVIHVNVPRVPSSDSYEVRLKFDYHSCNCSLCSVPRREQGSRAFLVPLNEAAIIIPLIISDLERLK